MSFMKRVLAYLLACVLLSSMVNSGASVRASAQGVDETALRNLVEQYYGAYARKDVDSLKALWSEKSPDAAPALKNLQRIFTVAESIALASLSVTRVEIDGDRAFVRAALEMNVVTKTGRPAPGFGKMNRALRFVREGSGWKLWREVSYEEEVSARLAAAATDAERQQLLARESGLIVAELARTLNQQGMQIDDQGDFPRALEVFQLALKFIEQADFKPGIIRVLNNIGYTRRRLGDYTESLRYLQRSLQLAREIDDK